MNIRQIIVCISTLCCAWSQTQVDLKTQAKSNVDFSQAMLTKPVRAGAVLPATCTAAEMFFKTNASAGQNLFACVATDTWALLSGIPDAASLLPPLAGNAGKLLTTDGTDVTWSAVPPGSVTIQNGAAIVGTRPAMEFIAGTGLISAISDTGSEIRVQHTVDTSVIETVQSHQSGTPLLCAAETGSSSAYLCSLNPALTGYTRGMRLHWVPDVSGAGGVTTLNVDLLGAKRVMLAGGEADPSAADIQAGVMYDLWYDGTEFRFVSPDGLLTESVATPRPTCEAGISGRISYSHGGPGVKDELSVCSKDQADAYGWRILY